MYQGGSDDFLGPCDDVVVREEEYGIDFEAEIAVITGDVPMAATPGAGAGRHPAGDDRQRRVACAT